MLMQKSREGFAMFVVIIGVLVLSTMTMTALDMGTQEARSARATRVSASALYVAETGVSIERAERATGTWPELSPGATWVGGWRQLTNGGRYRPTIQRRDGGCDRFTETGMCLSTMQIYSLTVEGWSPGPLGGQATIQIWATRFKVTARFTSAVGANGHLRVNGTNTLIDSYDSRVGAYGATLPDGTTNVGSDGDVHANGTISLAGSGSHIYGDAETVTTTIIDANNNITGEKTTGVPQVLYPVETCPDYTETMPGPVYSKKPDFEFGGTEYTWPAGGTYSFRDFKMSGTSTVTIPDGQSVKIYLSGQLAISGQSIIKNQNGEAAALSFVACNRGATPNLKAWSVTGGTEAYFTVYTPNTRLDVNGSSPIFGALVGNDVNVTGGAAVHYDISLGVVEDEDPQDYSSIMPRSWRQLLR
jgi:hypothetical protein